MLTRLEGRSAISLPKRELIENLIFIFLLGCYTKFFLYVTLGCWHNLISRRLVIIESLLLLSLTIISKNILVGSKPGSWKTYQLIFNGFLSNCGAQWNSSVSTHFSTLNKPSCFSIGAALIVSLGTYFFIPGNPLALHNFMPEHLSLYSMVDTSPQRIAYQIFLLIVMAAAVFFGLRTKNSDSPNMISKQLSTILGLIVLMAAFLTVWSFHLETIAIITLIIIVSIAFLAQYGNLHWLGWIFIATIIASAMLPGWLHSPEPPAWLISSFDQHYDSLLYRGRQLAAGHLFSLDAPPLYSLIWATFIGILAKNSHVPTLVELVRFVQIGQVLCLVMYMLAALIQTRGQSVNVRAVALTLVVAIVVHWLSTDGSSTWCPTQSGLRFLFFPISICAVFLIEKTFPVRAGIIAGLVVGLALLANFETGVAIMAGVGMGWLVRMRNERPQIWLISGLSGCVALLGCYFALDLMYQYNFGSPIFPNGITSTLVSDKLTFYGGFAGIKLSFCPPVIIIIAHASYKFMQSVRGVFNRRFAVPNAVTSSIATMLLVWMPYYIHRPSDWNLWTFCSIYSILLISNLKGKPNKDMLTLVVASLIILPITAKYLHYSILDPLSQLHWRSENMRHSCAGGLFLQKGFCAHLETRAKTIRDLAKQGSVAWSTALPVLTDQTTSIKSPFWTANLFGITLTNNDFNRLVDKINHMNIDFLLFDNPDDPFIHPTKPEVSFNQKLYESLRGHFCSRQLHGGWLVARRNKNGSCGGKNG